MYVFACDLQENLFCCSHIYSFLLCPPHPGLHTGKAGKSGANSPLLSAAE